MVKAMPLFAVSACSLALGSCSYSIDVIATVIGGKVAFTTTDDDFDCIENITVLAEDGVAPKASPGDDIRLVKNAAAYWYTDNPVTACSAMFPVVYGQKVGNKPPAVAPKELRVNVIYEVTTQGDGAYGGGRFRIQPNHRIENLPFPRARDDVDNGS